MIAFELQYCTETLRAQLRMKGFRLQFLGEKDGMEYWNVYSDDNSRLGELEETLFADSIVEWAPVDLL